MSSSCAVICLFRANEFARIYLLDTKEIGEYRSGFLFYSFIFLIGIGRFVLDFWREGYIEGVFLAGQWLSLPMIYIGIKILLRDFHILF